MQAFIKKSTYIVAIVGCSLSFQAQGQSLRAELVKELFQKSMQDKNYRQAYMHLKYLEKFQSNQDPLWVYNKVKCLIHIANFQESNDPFVKEVKSSIEYLYGLDQRTGNVVRNNSVTPIPKPKQEEKVITKNEDTDEENEDDYDEADDNLDEESLEDEQQDKQTTAITKHKAQTDSDTNVDMDWIAKVQMNYFMEGPKYDFWMKDPEYKKGQQLLDKNNFEKALENFTYATSKNNGLAFLAMAQMYERGLGMVKDLGTANSYYELAAEAGIAIAYLALAEYLRLDGETVMSLEDLSQEDLDNYKTLLERAADMNISKAKYLLGQFYLDAPNIKMDKKEREFLAYDYMVQAAAQGDINAQYLLAKMHCKGTGTIRSHDEAQYWINVLSQAQIISSEKIVELQDCIKDL